MEGIVPGHRLIANRIPESVPWADYAGLRTCMPELQATDSFVSQLLPEFFGSGADGFAAYLRPPPTLFTDCRMMLTIM